ERQDSVSIMTLHAAKGLEFPVVYLLAVEEGLLPHERSLAKDEDLEEERRLAFVGMARAKEERYLCHARLREFRGQTLYAVPSMFLDELPAEGIEAIDLSLSSAGRARAIDEWRDGGPAAHKGWEEAGITLRKAPETKATGKVPDYAAGMIVRHDKYGTGKVTEVSGFGTNCKVKVRFSAAGERTFLIEKAKLSVVHK